MPRLVGAQNPHRKVPRAARGGTHGVRVSQSSQHPSRTRPSSASRLSFSAPVLVSGPLSHPGPDPIPAGGRGRKGLIFLFKEGEGNKPFLELQPHKESGGMIRCRRVRGGAPGWPPSLPASFCGG
uniref:Uncharacterized protein LOC105077078 n=1 Tax=Camelus bactrianus TaxID=9837 RepID=A0A9W3GZC7_CAMBA|nr:uncharacterized protein LOC105077078 [Camelus bactrianus]